MKQIDYFYLAHCPHCKKADQMIADLQAQHPEYRNIEIAKIYEANKGRINIYHVCLDFDQLAWKNAAVNLPWTVVYDPNGERSVYVSKYNVQTLPAVYIYNAKGELVDQAVSFSDMSSKLSKL